MPRDPLLRRALLLATILAAAACGQGEDEDDEPPPTPVPLPAVGPSPPFDSLLAAPESLAVAGVQVRLESSLFQDYMPGDLPEDPVDPRSMVSGGLWLLPASAGVITDAWMLEDGEAERLDVYRAESETSVSGRPRPRLEHVNVVVRFRTAAGDTLFLQQRAAPVMKVE